MIAWVSRGAEQGWIGEELVEHALIPKKGFSFGAYPFQKGANPSSGLCKSAPLLILTIVKALLYTTNNLKNWEFGKGGALNLGQALAGDEAGPVNTQARWSRDPKSGMPTQSKTNFSSCLGTLYTKRIDTPTRAEWGQSVGAALASIKQGQLQKVVLARKTTLIFPRNIDPWQVFSLIAARRKNAALFLIQPQLGKAAFLGASPERLYLRKKNVLQTEAIAGTRALQNSSYFPTSKEQKEHDFVKEFIREHLAKLCSSVEEEKETILETAHLKHLCSRFSGTIHPHIVDEDILAALHPTPAVAGMPRQEALSFLQKIEPFRRGYYSGVLGCFDEDETEVFVGIRSALVVGQKVHLFAGVGIVEGSDPEAEWQELEQKIALFL